MYIPPLSPDDKWYENIPASAFSNPEQPSLYEEMLWLWDEKLFRAFCDLYDMEYPETDIPESSSGAEAGLDYLDYLYEDDECDCLEEPECECDED